MEQILLVGGRRNGSLVEVKSGAAGYYQNVDVSEDVVTIERYVRMVHEKRDGCPVFRHQFMTGEVE